ncbi:MAG: hypothetical protein AAGA09_03300 [Pseudomonadota bacterium]
MAAAQNAQPAPHPLEQHYREIATGLSALSACPGLIEDWEYSELSDYRRGLQQQIEKVSGQKIRVAFRRGVLTNGAGFQCEDPRLAEEAQRLRNFVHHQWKTRYDAMSQNGACSELLGQYGHFIPLLKTIDQQVRLTLPDTQEARADRRKSVTEMADQLAPICPKHSPLDGLFDPVVDSVLDDLFAPIHSGARRAENEYRDRTFDLNLGYTMGAGETRSYGVSGRNTEVLAKRHSDPVQSRVLVRKAACGHFINGQDPDDSNPCLLSIDASGGLAMATVTKGLGAPILLEWHKDAVLRIYDPSNSNVVMTLTPMKKDGVVIVGQHAANGVTYFENLLAQTRELHPLAQLNIMLIDEDGREMPLTGSVGEEGIPRTVAISDLRQAFSYAYASNDNDLTTGGLTEPSYTFKKAERE